VESKPIGAVHFASAFFGWIGVGWEGFVHGCVFVVDAEPGKKGFLMSSNERVYLFDLEVRSKQVSFFALSCCGDVQRVFPELLATPIITTTFSL
jgi:hypothetical protein